MRMQHWLTSSVILFICACGTGQPPPQNQEEAADTLSNTDATFSHDDEGDVDSSYHDEVSNDDESDSIPPPQPQTNQPPKVEMKSFYSEGYHDEKPKRSSDPKTKICVRNKVDEDIHFRVSQKVGGSFGTTLNKGSSFCSSDLTAGSVTVARDRQGQRHCEYPVEEGGSYILVQFRKNGNCEWEES